MKWNESGFRPPLCTYRLNWARRTWGWWDDWDDTVLQTQDSKFEPCRSEVEHATSRSRRLPTILTSTRGWGRNIFVSFKPPRPGTEPRTLAWKAAVLTTTLGPPTPSRWCLQNYMEKGWELTSELTSKWITFNNTQSNFTPISLITFAVINQTSSNLQGSCRNTSRWCLQNYMENSSEVTSELTFKWITFNNTQSNFTTISLIIFAVINQTSQSLH